MRKLDRRRHGEVASDHSERKACVWRRCLLPLALMVLVVLARLPFWCNTADDALITMRYARNAAAGEGLVYNAGERVQGSTTPLYSLLLTGVGCMAPGAIVEAGKGMGLAFDLAVAALLVSVLRRDVGLYWAFFGAVLYAVSPLTALWSVSGMETSLYTLAILAALAAYDRGMPWLAGLAAGICVLTRPDGVAVVAAIGLHADVFRRTIPWRTAAVAVAVVLPWALFSQCYFGGLVPNSVGGKMLQIEPGYWRAVKAMCGHLVLRPARLPMTLAAALGAWHAWRSDRLRVAVIWAVGYTLGFTMARARVYAWYQAPLEMVMALFAAHGLAAAERFVRNAVAGRGLFDRVAAAGRAVLAALLVAVGAGRLWVAAERTRLHARYLADTHAAAGRWLRAHGRPDQTVAVNDIGWVGWESGLRILDLSALVSPGLASLIAEHRGDDGFVEGVLDAFAPDYCLLRVSGGVDDVGQDIVGAFSDRGYERLQTFPSGDIRDYGRMNGMERARYILYRRAAGEADRELEEGGV